jgi:signal transduction histidine kinase
MADATQGTKRGLTSMMKGLAGKVLWLSIIFVLLGELLIFLPSIANFRIQWLKSRIAQAELAALAAEASPDKMLDGPLKTEILKGAGVTSVSLTKEGSRHLVLKNADDGVVSAQYDLRSGMYYDTAGEAVRVMFGSEDRMISVTDHPPNMSGDVIAVSLHEAPLRDAMRKYALNILGLSIVLSLIVASLIFAALYFVLVRPMRRLTSSMLAFADDPQNPSRVIKPSRRQDEIGSAERELQSMQSQLQSSLNQKAHLAALGLAASKVSHDLRNMLTSAQLISDRLADVKDPTVQRMAPKLISSLDRAITFLSQTLRYGKAQELPPNRSELELQDIASDVVEQCRMQYGHEVDVYSSITRGTRIHADREHLTRILSNLMRNACEAMRDHQPAHGAKLRVGLEARRRDVACEIRVTDNGPGIPLALRDRLFEPFQTGQSPGGTGLGLAISNELARAHGGLLEVASTGPEGTSFRLIIPDRS